MDLIPNFNSGFMSAVTGGLTPKTFADIAPAFKVEKVIKNLDDVSKDPQIVISVNDHNVSQYQFKMKICDIYDTRTVCRPLAAYGIVLDTAYKKPIERYLTDGYKERCKCNQVEYVHNILGWHTVSNGQDIFLYDKNNINGTTSTYQNEDFKFHKGSEKDYKDFLAKTVYPVETLSLAMAIGYSAVVISRLKGKVDLGTVIVNLCSESSKGKTTVEELMVSAFASPLASDNGLMKTFLSTENAIYEGINGINGLPIVLDDTSNAKIPLQDLVYTLSSGTPKKRCSSRGNVNDNNAQWSGVVIISSETSMQESFSLDGAKARVIDARDITWTPDAQTANLIKATVREHYGHTGYEFANYISSMTIDDLYSKYLLAEATVNALMVKRDGLSDRLAMKYAVIYLTIQLMNDCFKLSLNEDNLIKILINPEQDNIESRDSSEKALDELKDFVFTHKNKFNWYFRIKAEDNPYRNLPDQEAKGEDYGSLEYSDNGCILYVSVDAMSKFFTEKRIRQKLAIKKKWKENGIIEGDPQRYDTKHMKRRVMKFLFPDGLDFDIEYPPKEKAEESIVTKTPKSDYDVNDSEAIAQLFEEGENEQ